MSQRVPSWDVHYINHSNSTDLSKLEDYEVAELTWQNGKISMNGFSLPRVPAKPFASGTLESIVNQATRYTADRVAAVYGGDSHGSNRRRAAASNTMTMDALVPCSNGTEEQSTTGVVDSVTGGAWRRVGCCSKRRAGVARVHVDGGEWCSQDQSVSGRDSHHVTLDTCERELDSPENTSSARQWRRTAASVEDHDSVCYSTQRDEGEEEYLEDNNKRSVKSSVSNKRSRAAAVHNQSERKRRDKINQRMSTLQKLVPNSSKTDKASILDEVIEYVKQLQAQLQMMSRMSMSSMMLPMNMPHQLNMSMMAPMGMGLGMGLGLGPMGMDMSTLARPSIPILHPTTTFMPMTSWDPSANGSTLTPMAAPGRPMTMDAYSKMVAMYQQLQQMDPSSSKS